MLTFSIILLTVLLIFDCLILGLLILIQLPKKEAGVGVAFGGGTTDALFGAGSGNALSKLTSYTSVAFFILVFALSVANNRLPRSNAAELKQQLEQSSAPAPTTSPMAQPAAAAPLLISTNMTVAPASNAPVKVNPVK
jgi:preprotein translocase subunit SecG